MNHKRNQSHILFNNPNPKNPELSDSKSQRSLTPSKRFYASTRDTTMMSSILEYKSALPYRDDGKSPIMKVN
jgi:hypothetical protein